MEGGQSDQRVCVRACVRWWWLVTHLGVARAGDDEELLAAREEDWQDCKRLLDLLLIDTRLVEPNDRHAPLLALEPFGPRADRGPLWLARVLP